MKVGIYNEPGGHGIGGSEHVAAVLAEALAQNHDVELVHHIAELSAPQLAQSSGTDLTNVRLRYVERDPDSTRYFRNPRQRFRFAKKWHADFSEPYDFFLAILHGLPPFCHAHRGGLIVLFPAQTASYLEPPTPDLLKQSRARQRVEYLYRKYEWRNRIKGYQVVTSISEFTRSWTSRRWGVDSCIVYPPVDQDFDPIEKEKMILSVGRFALPGEGHTKKQAEMLRAFKQMEAEGLQDWEYVSVGGLRHSPEHRAFLESLANQAASCRRARVAPNLERSELKGLYERAGVFWHAAGYNESELADPVLMEHFGISTVEAMAAGCVPVVINRGGQPEIVEHGVSGFLWDTLEELKHYTALLAGDQRLRAHMSLAARQRAKCFSRDEFVGRFLRLLHPLLSSRNRSS